MAHTRTWDASYEADPDDSDQASGGALDIRQTKQDVRERLELDHSWAGDDNDGYHKKVTFVDPLGAKPTQANDETYLYTKDVAATSELFFEDESGNEVQVTSAGVGAWSGVLNAPATTAMVFYQDSAPTGWTIAAAVDEHAVRLTKGSVAGGQAGGAAGGTNNFSTQFASLAEGATPGVGDHQLTIPEMPAHDHTLTLDSANTGSNFYPRANDAVLNPVGPNSTAVGDTGGDGTHGHTIDLRVKWAACIVATKD